LFSSYLSYFYLIFFNFTYTSSLLILHNLPVSSFVFFFFFFF